MAFTKAALANWRAYFDARPPDQRPLAFRPPTPPRARRVVPMRNAGREAARGEIALRDALAKVLTRLSLARYALLLAESSGANARIARCRAELTAATAAHDLFLGPRRLVTLTCVQLRSCSQAGAKASSVPLSFGSTLPTEIRLFSKGVNETEKGPFLFDAEAARLVMAHYEARGVELMFDLEHLSTDESSPAYDPDARGWGRLEIRNGELWAVDIRWTDDGAARLNEKRQRYVSPFLGWEELPDGQRRIVEVVNVAICANPATHNTPALIAASLGAR